MLNPQLRFTSLLALLLFAALACNYRAPSAPDPAEPIPVSPAAPGETPAAATTLPAPDSERLLTVCMGQEPASLFLYGDQSAAARAVRQAIYDGPYEWVNYQFTPVILESQPTLANQGAVLQPVSVQPGDALVDANGRVVRLGEGVSYFPPGCQEAGCALAYSGTAPVETDQLTVRFVLKSGLTWSDGSPLTADDSLYSYETARALYPLARADLLDRTQSYRTIDDATLEWVGLPGYRYPAYAGAFFSPLPRQAWGTLAARELNAADASSRRPMGWGPYIIEEWSPGDHISLKRNPSYFRAAEGLPHFARLVFRFMADRDAAVNALLAGECDLLDESLHLETQTARLLQLQQGEQLALSFRPGSAWEQAVFGLLPSSAPEAGGPLPFFQPREVRLAVAQCIDREKLGAELFSGQVQPAHSYALPGHPLLNPDLPVLSFDPAAAAQRLEAAGWSDADGSPATPRLARGVPGVPDDTAFEFSFITTDEAEKTSAAQIMQAGLAECGIRMNVDARPPAVVFTAGQEAPVFGRKFSLAQFGWTAPLEPPCFLYTTAEIPGPYPDFPRGWGGANAGGYSSPEFDRLCRQAQTSLPDWPGYQQAHFAAQKLFADDMPVIALYVRPKLVVTRADFCNLNPDQSSDSILYNLEDFNYGRGCQP